MSILTNRKHEHFASLVASGSSATRAAVTAGYSERRAASTGSELMARPEVSARVMELRGAMTERQVERVAVDRAWVMEKLAKIVAMGMQAEPVLDDKGNAAGEYRQNLTAANKALELIGKELGMFVDRKEVRSGPLDGLSPEELKALDDALGVVLARRPEPKAGPESGGNGDGLH